MFGIGEEPAEHLHYLVFLPLQLEFGSSTRSLFNTFELAFAFTTAVLGCLYLGTCEPW